MLGAKYYGIHLQYQAEVGRSQVLGWPGLHSKPLFQNKRKRDRGRDTLRGRKTETETEGRERREKGRKEREGRR